MTTFTIAILAVILASNIEVGRNHRLRRQERIDEDGDDDIGWPQPGHINQFEKPGLLPDPEPVTVSDDNELSLHHGSRHRSRHH